MQKVQLACTITGLRGLVERFKLIILVYKLATFHGMMLKLNLSTRLHKSNFDYFATKWYGQLSIQWTIVLTMSISWT